jgi:hypothetical protein
MSGAHKIVVIVMVSFMVLMMISSPLAAGCGIVSALLIVLLNTQGISMQTNRNPGVTMGVGGVVLVGFFSHPGVFFFSLMAVSLILLSFNRKTWH